MQVENRTAAELYDKAKQQADRKQELVALWERYARENGVVQAEPEPAPEGGADDAAQKSSPSDR